jgi:hypothetical protein
MRPITGTPTTTAVSILLLLLLQACAAGGGRVEISPAADAQRIAALDRAILALGEHVDADEASRAARISIEYSRQLAREYEVSGSPILHNMMVNLGIRSRGLCVHWTRDLRDRLDEEAFRSLDLHWAIANYESLFRIEHSTVVISARGDGLQQGLVLDPWRNAGELYWSPTLEDTDYRWRPQAEIHALKDQRAEERQNRRVLR